MLYQITTKTEVSLLFHQEVYKTTEKITEDATGEVVKREFTKELVLPSAGLIEKWLERTGGNKDEFKFTIDLAQPEPPKTIEIKADADEEE